MSTAARKPKTPKPTELWHVGLVHAPIASALNPAQFVQARTMWLPHPRPFCFVADPFAVREAGGGTTVYVEALDYRTKRGEIHFYAYDNALQLKQQGVALRAKHHLSYPFLVQHEGTLYMLPEAHRSGKLTLYKNTGSPDAWEEARTLLHQPAIDASPVFYDGLWWLFYALPSVAGGNKHRALSEMHLAFSESLCGPWREHPQTPVRTGRASSRMGGTPFVHQGILHLPVQECETAYGTAVRLLKVTTLTPERFVAEEVARLAPEGVCEGYGDGLHTLSACLGAPECTLIDVKRLDANPKRGLIDMQRKLRRLVGLA